MTEVNRLRVVSVNLRGPDDDEPNCWPSRLPVVTGILRERRPDVVGTQEGLYPRLEQLADALADLHYRWIGLGREGGSRSEFMAIFYRHDRFEPVEFDHFWLSPSPKTIASVLPEGNPENPRMVTWVRLRDRGSGRELVHVNTHRDERSDPADQLRRAGPQARGLERMAQPGSAEGTSDTIHLEWGVPCQSVEVPIGMEDRERAPDGDSADKAVDELSHRFSLPTACSVQGRGGLKVAGLRRNDGGPSQQASEIGQVLLVAGPRQYFHSDGVARGNILVQERVDSVAYRAVGVSKKLDPRRRVDQDHAVRPARSASKSPSHPDPLSRLAWSGVRTSPARAWRAKFTASRLVAKW